MTTLLFQIWFTLFLLLLVELVFVVIGGDTIKEEPIKLTEVQATSLLVAFFRQIETHRNQSASSSSSNPLIVDKFASVLLEKLGMDENVVKWKNSPFLDPGIDILALRTRTIDDWLIEGSRRQIVNLGSGMCTRPYRLNLKSDVVVFEVEKDGTLLQAKRQALKDHEPKVQIVDVTADVSEDLEEALALAKINPMIPTDWIAEGLLAYLPVSSHLEIFRAMHRLSAPGSRFIATNVKPEFQDYTNEIGISFPHVGFRTTEGLIAELRQAGWSRNTTQIDDHVFYQRFKRAMNVPVCMVATEWDNLDVEEPEF